MADTTRVRHDAELRVTFHERGRRRNVLSVDIVKAYLLDAHITVKAVMYGGVSGMVCWSDPATGQRLRGVQYHYELVDPEAAVLKEGELCDCEDVCQPALQPT